VWKNADVSKSRYLNHLRNVPLFAGCTKKQLEHVASIVTELNIPKGSNLMVEGEMIHEFVIIESGSASVRRGGRKVATVGAGDVVGELAMILRRPRTATVTADSDLNVLVVDERSFNALLDEVPGLARRLLHTVAERMADNAKPTQVPH
jgi:CRP-like cAMP-binding protein